MNQVLGMAQVLKWAAALAVLATACLSPLVSSAEPEEPTLTDPELEAMLTTKEQLEKANLKGNFETKNGIFYYVSGSPSASKAIVYVYGHDGFTENTLYNADLLAADNTFQVYMPDMGGYKAEKESKPISAEPRKITWIESWFCKKYPCHPSCPIKGCPQRMKVTPPPPPPPPPPVTPKPPPPPPPPTPTPKPATPKPGPKTPPPSDECTCTCEGEPEYTWRSETCPASPAPAPASTPAKPPSSKGRAMRTYARALTSICASNGTYNDTRDPKMVEEIEKVIPNIPDNLRASVGLFGTEWGANYVVQMATIMTDKFKAGVIVDAVEVAPEAGCRIKVPLKVVWGGAEKDHTELYNALVEKMSADKISKEVYPEAQTNFFGSTADRSNEGNKKAVADLISKTKEFFLKNL